jgi:SAM-dependent methyltransferase
MENFKAYSKYYDLLYGDKDYKAEVNYVAKQIKTFAPNAKSILEFGSGTGKHGMMLQEKGYKVFGLDQSEYMVAEAKKRGLDSQVADISNFKLKEKYDAIVSLFHVVCYLTSNEALVATFKNANKHLNKDGIFLFDLWYSPAVYEQKSLPRIKKMKNKEVEVTRIADPKIDINSNMITVRYTVLIKNLSDGKIDELYEEHPVRHFSIPEIGLLAELTGFKILKAEELITGKEPSVGTWGVCFVLQKI